MFGTDTIGLRAGELSDNSFNDDLIYSLTLAEAKIPFPESRRQQVSDELESLPPGIFLAAAVHRVERRRVGGHNLIRLLKARERLVSHYQAEAASDVAEVAHLAPGSDWHERSEHEWEYASDEIRAALCLTRRAAETRLAFALHLVDYYPRILKALAAGLIDHARAKVIVEGVANLPLQTALDIIDQIVDQAPDLTTGQIASLIRRLAIDVSPKEARERYENAVEKRRVWFEPTIDGTVNLHGYDLPVERVRAICRRINGCTLNLKSRGDTRTHDQLRADVFLDLLDGSPTDRGSGKGSVDIRVDLTTLSGLDDKAAEIPGFGPILADIARQVAAQQTRSQWTFSAIDDNGNVVATGITRRRPTMGHVRHLAATQPTCVFPGCRMPAADCDIDHNQPLAEGGPNTLENTTPKCRHDHILRHQGGWTYRLVDGLHHWTSPLGHRYITKGRSP
ncbi:MAG: DUF222 domain-containing protein [Acidimicrobiia bacterium]